MKRLLLPGRQLHVAGEADPRPVLSEHRASALVAGTVVGSSTFKSHFLDVRRNANRKPMFPARVIGDIVPLMAALRTAEHAPACVNAGSHPHFPRDTYGKPMSFLFTCPGRSTATSGSMPPAFVSADYLARMLQLVGLNPFLTPTVLAGAAILVLPRIHLHSMKAGRLRSTVLPISKSGG